MSLFPHKRLPTLRALPLHQENIRAKDWLISLFGFHPYQKIGIFDTIMIKTS